MSVLYCPACDTPPDPLDWRCHACGAPLELRDQPPFAPGAIHAERWSMWRYAASLGVEQRVTLGAGMTALVPLHPGDESVWVKCEYLNPTGSYKDRGTETLLSYLASRGVTSVVEESSGNAGASMAQYAAHGGLRARIFVPENAPPGKTRAIAAAAELVVVPGPRHYVNDACLAAAVDGTIYASHGWNPYWIIGQQTLAWELWEQLGAAPAAIVTPAGQGGLLLGIARGFRALHAAGVIDRLPRLYAVQPWACDPFVRAIESGAAEPEPVIAQRSAADGTLVGSPVRGAQVLAAIREVNGWAFSVAEDDLLNARDRLARRGFYVEPTSAMTLAALPRVQQHLGGADGPIVLIATGNGLKAPS
ncbi:MAG: threonine synthase [Chloroflexi bacterium]|nr:MAG: pyridoxal-5'-phosphate-dependent protein subunit beta [Chloroflexi bacterium OLB13]MCC6564255.1 threonine synthase [Chloroflexota bacterium]